MKGCCSPCVCDIMHVMPLHFLTECTHFTHITDRNSCNTYLHSFQYVSLCFCMDCVLLAPNYRGLKSKILFKINNNFLNKSQHTPFLKLS